MIFSLGFWMLFELSAISAPELYPKKVAQGGVVQVTLEPSKTDTEISAFTVKAKPWKCPRNPKKLCAFIPVSHDTKPGPYEITFSEGETTKKLEFQVLDAKFPKTTIKVAKEMVEPSEEQKKRIADELEEVNQALRRASAEPYWSKPFKKPVDSRVTGIYGSSRVYNDRETKTHLGVDMRANEKTKVRAPNDATVLVAKEMFLAGGFVLLDHGGGVVTNYGHLSKILVTPGQTITRGTPIGYAGRTGRTTGPHLHWGVRVHTVSVDGLRFIALANGRGRRSSSPISRK